MTCPSDCNRRVSKGIFWSKNLFRYKVCLLISSKGNFFLRCDKKGQKDFEA